MVHIFRENIVVTQRRIKQECAAIAPNAHPWVLPVISTCDPRTGRIMTSVPNRVRVPTGMRVVWSSAWSY